MKGRILGVVLSVMMVFSMGTTVAFGAADSSWSFTAPESAVSTSGSDGTRYIKMNAFRASVPIAALLGADMVAGGNITWQTEDADGNTIGLNLMGSDVNVNPDTYVSNFLYVSRFFTYKNRVRTFAWLNADGTEATNEEVYSVLPQSEFMYPILTYDSNTHNMYASYGGNDTDTEAIAELGGVSKTLYMRPDLIVGNDGTSYADQIALINSFREGDEYYQDGDENYSPTFIETGVGTIDQKIEGVKTVAEALNSIKSESGGTLTTRYDDPEIIANDYEKAIYGIYYYVMSNLKEYGGTIEKKNVADVTAYNSDDGTYTVSTTFNPSLQLLGTHTTNKIAGNVTSEGSAAGETTEFKLTASDLTAFDFIRAESTEIKEQMFADFENLGLTEDQVPDVEEKTIIGVCNTAAPWACNVITQEFPITQIYIYRDELEEINPAINPAAMVAYIAENWYHISTSGNTLQNVTAKMLDSYWNSVSDLDTPADKINYVYDKEEIENCIEEGIAFAEANASNSDTWLDGSYNINDPIYQQITTGSNDHNVTIPDSVLNEYKENMQPHAWTPDLSTGIGSDGLPTTDTDYAAQAASQFTDVSESDWFAASVGEAVAKNLFVGLTENTFGPDNNMTRAMAVTVLYRMAGSPAVSGSSGFSDVSSSDYYADAVKWAVDNDITAGTSSGTFSPNDDVTREQFATFLYNYASATGGETSQRTDLSTWDDNSSISSWASEAISWAVDRGLIAGVTSTTLVPQGTATRAQIAAILVRYAAL
jgi:hypothetical protein